MLWYLVLFVPGSINTLYLLTLALSLADFCRWTRRDEVMDQWALRVPSTPPTQTREWAETGPRQPAPADWSRPSTTTPMPTSRGRACWIKFCRLGKRRPRQLPLHWCPTPPCLTCSILTSREQCTRDRRGISLCAITQGLTRAMTVRRATLWPANRAHRRHCSSPRESTHSLSTPSLMSHIISHTTRGKRREKREGERKLSAQSKLGNKEIREI